LTAGHLRHLADPRSRIGGPIDEVREAAITRQETLLDALGHDNPGVRAAAAFALAFLPELGDWSRPALRQRLVTEEVDEPLMSQALALALLARDGRDPEDDQAFEQLRTRDSTAARAAGALAAIALGDQDPQGLSDLAAQLVAPYASPVMPWGEGVLRSAVAALTVGTNQRCAVAVALLACLEPSCTEAVRSAVGSLALELGAFRDTWERWDVALPEELNDTQRAIAVAMAHVSGIEGLGWGVPRSVRDRRRWMGRAPAGALEKTIAVSTPEGDKSWPVWKVWQVLGTRPGEVDFPSAIIDALSADERLEAYGEVCSGAYNIIANRDDPPIEPVLEALSEVTDKAVAWARAYFAEMSELLAAESTPELGGSLGIDGMAPAYLALLARDEPIPTEFHAHLPMSTGDNGPARAILERLGTKAEEALWVWMSQPSWVEQPDYLVAMTIPVLDLVASKRVVGRVLKAIEGLDEEDAEEFLEQLRELAPSVPEVAVALK